MGKRAVLTGAQDAEYLNAVSGAPGSVLAPFGSIMPAVMVCSGSGGAIAPQHRAVSEGISSMSLSDFYRAFPKLAASELCTIAVAPNSDSTVPADRYAFLELYCDERGCDCRRVTVAAFAERQGETVAYISLGFDSADDMAGPFLDRLNPQAAYAPELLRIFIDMINSDPGYLARLQRHYVLYKERCEGRPYAGPAFEKPGAKKRIAADHPPLPALANLLGTQPITPVRRSDKVGRNDPCPCGSGKKYKHCCMVQGEPSKTGAARPLPVSPGRPGTLGPEAQTETPADVEAPMRTAEQLIAEVVRWRSNPRHQQPFSPAVQRTLETTRGLALAFLRLLLNRYAPDGRQPTPPEGYDLCLALLEEALTQIRYSVERQRPWAIALAEQVQMEMAEQAFRPEVDVRVQHDLIQALHSAKLEPHPCIRDQAAAVAAYYARFSAAGGAPNLDSLLGRLLRETRAEDPLELLEPMLAQMEVMPAEGQVVLAAGMLASSKPLFNELAVLLLLHPNAQVRAQLPERYGQADCLGHIGPVGLRRLIGLRNWLPEKERPGVDALIKDLRVSGVQSAPLTPAQPGTVYASAFDGSGAQGTWVVSKSKRHHRIDAVLVKQGFGIREVWGEGGFTKREIDDKVRGMTARAGALPVQRDYLPRLVAHFVAVGLDKGTAPPPQLAALNELMGGEYWKPEVLSLRATIAELRAGDPDAFTPARIQGVLDDARHWPDYFPFAVSWFEDDARVEAVLRESVGPVRDWSLRLPVSIRAIVDDVLEPRRGVWAERLLWMALWARAAEKRAPRPWQDFLIIAEALEQDRPLAQIPLMNAIALRTVQSALGRARAGSAVRT